MTRDYILSTLMIANTIALMYLGWVLTTLAHR